MSAAPIAISKSWATYTKLVWGDSMPHPIQYQEMRRAFYAGYFACLTDMTNDLTKLDEDAGVRTIAALAAEGLSFAAGMLRGEG